MSGKLSQSLDEIMKDSKPTGGAGGRRRGRQPRSAAVKSKAATKAVIAPTGGVQKKTKAAKPVAALPQTGESKISVSNLPEDVNESLIKASDLRNGV
jgi:THO complex subunit 4